MKNVTISMDDETAAWARVEAAKRGKSLSRYVGDVLAVERGKASATGAPADIADWIGSARGLFATPEEVDRFVRAERDQWD
jgi:hypothetical protein